METVLLEELTWTEVESALEDGTKTVLVPAGSVEQHGPHLGLLKDAAWAEAIGVELARALGDALVAPVIRPGCSEHHMGFPGTISYRPETLMRVFEDYCHSLDAHGFEHIVVFSMHGGNFPALNAILPSLAGDLDAAVITLLDKGLLIDPLMEALAAAGIPASARGHGGAAVTASVWHLRPDLVREEEFVPGYVGEVSTSTLTTHGLDAVTELGHMGDPTYATRELGEDVTNRLVTAFAERVRTERGDDR
ncbi:creatininase family protein [Halomarina ordinaria]|uniref:Creatininase family protein n=1 Tax=Halomarina ordinaria TaxID=3033939 RepID=A0ABD5UFM5_9EURY|nr:creatininase family protein [Halomarina sp. PSRA2]